jgi:3' terminal RNA ribose 2'-O-methyltransferase Hen1
VLSHLYVLIPVMDDDKHYWVGSDEVEKLLRKGAGWLGDHPEKELISSRYLAHKRSLAQMALERLLVDEPEADDQEEAHNKEEEQVEERISLNQQRMGSVLAALKACNARRVLDLGCGEGSLLRLLLQERQFERIVGMDVSHRALEIAARRLRLERMPPMQRERLELIQGSLIYRDERLSGFDAAAVVEVVEHLDPPRLGSFERALFEAARPAHVVLTTPNAEYNVRFPTLPAGKLRHKDHRFEWTRGQFESWSASVADRFGYAVRFVPVGPVDHEVGPPTQMAVFSR